MDSVFEPNEKLGAESGLGCGFCASQLINLKVTKSHEGAIFDAVVFRCVFGFRKAETLRSPAV
jgi:hypothetical protein